MADDLRDPGARDRERVNDNEDFEVRHWTWKFGCSESQLREAVKLVGPMVADVRAYLKKQKG